MIALVLVAVGGVYLLACVAAGLVRSTVKLDSFEADTTLPPRPFAEPASIVLDAFAQSATTAPGMTVIDRSSDSLLIDASPTSRILGGSFGMNIRIAVRATGETGSSVLVSSSKKVPFAFAVNEAAALVHSERTLRMGAKRLGVTEHIDSSA